MHWVEYIEKSEKILGDHERGKSLALLWAAFDCDGEAVKYLLFDGGIHPESTLSQDDFNRACLSSDRRLEKFSFTAGTTALRILVQHTADLRILDDLLVAGADINNNNEFVYRRTALDYALIGGNIEMCRFLIHRGAKITIDIFYPVLLRQSYDLCDFLIRNGFDINSRDKESYGLISSLCNGYYHDGNLWFSHVVENCKYLISRGIRLDLKELILRFITKPKRTPEYNLARFAQMAYVKHVPSLQTLCKRVAAVYHTPTDGLPEVVFDYPRDEIPFDFKETG